MKEYQFKVGLRSGFDNVSIQLQDGIKFFYDEKFAGDFKVADCNHYTTVIPITEFTEWQEYLKVSCPFHVIKQQIGDYLVVSIDNVKNDNDLPIVSREEWFKENNIDFSNITIYTKDSNMRGMYVARIIEFKNIDDIDYKIVTRRDFFSQGPYYSISLKNGKFSTFCHLINSHDYSEILTGDKANKYWDTMVHLVLSKIGMPTSVDLSLDFDEEFIVFAKTIIKDEIV